MPYNTLWHWPFPWIEFITRVFRPDFTLRGRQIDSNTHRGFFSSLRSPHLYLLYTDSPCYHTSLIPFSHRVFITFYTFFSFLRDNFLILDKPYFMLCIRCRSISPLQRKLSSSPAHHLHARTKNKQNSTAFMITIRYIIHNSFFFQRNISTCSTTVTFYLFILLLQFV